MCEIILNRNYDISKDIADWGFENLDERSFAVIVQSSKPLSKSVIKRKAGLKEGGKDRPFSACPCGLAMGRVASPRSDHKDPSDWRDIRRRREQSSSSIRKNACA